MDVLGTLSQCAGHWSLGLTVLVALAAAEFSGPATAAALPLAAAGAALAALCAPPPAAPRRARRRPADVLDFCRIWLALLETLAAAATSARVASATLDYITAGHLRALLLGREAGRLGEPWPDVVGVSVILVVTGLFMLGLERSKMFGGLLLVALVTTVCFFWLVGGLHTVIQMDQWLASFRSLSLHSVLAAATVCSYAFVNTFQTNLSGCKLAAITLIPLFAYIPTTAIFTLMSHYHELRGTATPLLRIFELRDVNWARLAMAISIITIACLALTEIMPTLYSIFLQLASADWQIFLTSLQYKNEATGAPTLAIFAGGSLAAILAFACPLAYLVKILSMATLLKATVTAYRLLYAAYRPEFDRGEAPAAPPPLYRPLRPKRWPRTRRPLDDECLLLAEYATTSGAASDESASERESALSASDSDDIDSVVEEYRDQVRVASALHDAYAPTRTTLNIVAGAAAAVTLGAAALTAVLRAREYKYASLCLVLVTVATVVVLLMPKNAGGGGRPAAPLGAVASVVLNVALLETIVIDVWIGFAFWMCVGGLLLWRCECCACDGLDGVAARVGGRREASVDEVLVVR